MSMIRSERSADTGRPRAAVTGRAAASASRSGGSPVTALALMELRLLMRKKSIASIALLLPIALVGLTFVGERPDSPGRWGATLGLHFTIALLLTAYLNTATVLTTRRDSLVFKRLRTSELSGAGLIVATILPIAIISMLQVVVMIAVNLATGAPLPQRPELVAAGFVLGLLLTIAAAGAISALTASAERVQLTTMPVLIGAAIGAQIITGGFADPVTWGALAFPLVPAADLVNKGWAGSEAGVSTLPLPVDVVAADVALLVAWLVAGAWLAKANWRWEPRS